MKIAGFPKSEKGEKYFSPADSVNIHISNLFFFCPFAVKLERYQVKLQVIYSVRNFFHRQFRPAHKRDISQRKNQDSFFAFFVKIHKYVILSIIQQNA